MNLLSGNPNLETVYKLLCGFGYSEWVSDEHKHSL